MKASAPIPAGWYPDPVDTSQQRYFDGTTWSHHVAHRPGYLAPPAPVRRRYRRRVIGALVAAVLVVAATYATASSLRSSAPAEPMDFPTISAPAEPAEPEGPEVVPGGSFAAGEQMVGRIEQDQQWQGSLTVADGDGLVLLDARPVPPGADLVMRAYTTAGEQIAGNDDRGELSRIGGTDLDPILVLGAREGSVDVTVGSFMDEASTDFEVRTSVPEQIDAPFDQTWQVQEAETVIRTLVVPEAGTYLFEVMATGGAHGFFIDTVAGEVTTWRSGAEHIAEEMQVEPGTHLMIASRDALDAGALQLRITTG